MKLDEHLQLVPAEGRTPFEAVDDLLDLESLADMLILEELVQNYDVGAGSFYMAVDFTADSRYRKLTIFICVCSLFHTAIDQKAFTTDFQQCARTGYFVGCA